VRMVTCTILPHESFCNGQLQVACPRIVPPYIVGHALACWRSSVTYCCKLVAMPAGLNKTVHDALDEGKADFNRYAESGQVMINRAQHLGESLTLLQGHPVSMRLGMCVCMVRSQHLRALIICLHAAPRTPGRQHTA
jgi:hypothetical protein